MMPSHLSLIPTKELLTFAKRHAVQLGRTNSYRTLNHYVQLGLLPRKRRYSDGRIRWGFPPAAKGLLLRIRDLKREGFRLNTIREKLDELMDQETERAKHAPPTLGSPEDPDTPPPDTSLAYFHEGAKEVRNCLRSGMVRNADRLLEELIDLAAPYEPGDEVTILVDGAPQMTEVYRVSSSGSAEYLCSMHAMEPLALEQGYGPARFHCVVQSHGGSVFDYDVLVPDRVDLQLEPCLPRKAGPTLHFMDPVPNHEYQIYRVEGEASSFLCQDPLWRVTPEMLAREHGSGTFRLVVETADRTRHAYGLVIQHAPAEPTQRPDGGSELLLGRTRWLAPAPPLARQAKCPGCNRWIMKRDGDRSFVSTNGLLFDHNQRVFQIRCKHCKTPIKLRVG